MNFFDSTVQGEKNFARLLAELESWRGTKFIPFVAKKGVGVDCVRFAAAVLQNVGAIEPFAWPAYVIEGGGQAMLEILLRHTDQVQGLARTWTHGQDNGPIMRGDLLLVSSGRHLHHFAIFTVYPVLWHCLRTDGVCQGNIEDPIVRDHLWAVYRAKG